LSIFSEKEKKDAGGEICSPLIYSPNTFVVLLGGKP